MKQFIVNYRNWTDERIMGWEAETFYKDDTNYKNDLSDP